MRSSSVAWALFVPRTLALAGRCLLAHLPLSVVWLLPVLVSVCLVSLLALAVRSLLPARGLSGSWFCWPLRSFSCLSGPLRRARFRARRCGFHFSPTPWCRHVLFCSHWFFRFPFLARLLWRDRCRARRFGGCVWPWRCCGLRAWLGCYGPGFVPWGGSFPCFWFWAWGLCCSVGCLRPGCCCVRRWCRVGFIPWLPLSCWPCAVLCCVAMLPWPWVWVLGFSCPGGWPGPPCHCVWPICFPASFVLGHLVTRLCVWPVVPRLPPHPCRSAALLVLTPRGVFLPMQFLLVFLSFLLLLPCFSLPRLVL